MGSTPSTALIDNDESVTSGGANSFRKVRHESPIGWTTFKETTKRNEW